VQNDAFSLAVGGTHDQFVIVEERKLGAVREPWTPTRLHPVPKLIRMYDDHTEFDPGLFAQIIDAERSPETSGANGYVALARRGHEPLTQEFFVMMCGQIATGGHQD